MFARILGKKKKKGVDLSVIIIICFTISPSCSGFCVFSHCWAPLPPFPSSHPLCSFYFLPIFLVFFPFLWLPSLTLSPVAFLSDFSMSLLLFSSFFSVSTLLTCLSSHFLFSPSPLLSASSFFFCIFSIPNSSRSLSLALSLSPSVLLREEVAQLQEEVHLLRQMKDMLSKDLEETQGGCSADVLSATELRVQLAQKEQELDRAKEALQGEGNWKMCLYVNMLTYFYLKQRDRTWTARAGAHRWKYTQPVNHLCSFDGF